MKAHANVAIFVPHIGCPHACSFCDQYAISGEDEPPCQERLTELLEAGRKNLEGRDIPAEIAFFGGSFTAIDAGYRRSLLEAAQPFLGEGGFDGIRISTRPDAIDGEILRELKEYGVTAIELGAQSMDDQVLMRNMRGHTASQVEKAALMVREAGFSLGLQMMTGLPGDTTEGAVLTAEKLISLNPDTVRIYPVLTLEGTYLETLYNTGEYIPQTLDEAVLLCGKLLELFTVAGIRVIRMGLHQSETMQSRLVAGPHHPAFRELAEGELMFCKALALIRENSIPPGDIVITVPPGSESKMAGQNRRNIIRLKETGYTVKIKTDSLLDYLGLRIENKGLRI